MITGTLTEEEIQAAWVGYLKTQPTVLTYLASGTSIKEYQWQGTDFVYPAIRIYVDVFPPLPGCGPTKAEICTEVYAEDKSSYLAKLISGAISRLVHKHPFTFNGLKFVSVVVTKVDHSERNIYAWRSRVMTTVLVNP